MARVLVIGGTLFIGRAMVEQLLARGDDVVIMHRGAGTPFGDRVREIACDRNDAAAVHRALTGERFDVVYDNVYDWARGTSAEQVLAAARATAPGLRRYVFTSSVAVYPPGGPHDEDSALVPSDFPNPYGAQKAESERALFALGQAEGLPVTTLRPAFVHGVYNPFDREAFFWDRLRDDRPIIIPGDGQATMQWVSSHDVARAAILASEKDAALGRAYNLASQTITQEEFVRMLARIAGKEPNLVRVPRERIAEHGGGLMAPPLYFGVFLDVPPITVEASRVHRELGLELTPLEAGLQDTYAWYTAQARPPRDYAWEDALLAAAP